MKRKWPIVEVEWEDSMHFGEGWKDCDVVIECAARKCGMMQYTAGYLMKRSRRYIIIVGSQSDLENSDRVVGEIQIPRSAIRNLRTLKEKD